MLSHLIPPCSMVALSKISSSDFMMPLSDHLDLSNNTHFLDTSMSFMSSIHKILLPNWYFLLFSILGCQHCSKSLWFPCGYWSHTLNTSPYYCPQIVFIFFTTQNPVTWFVARIQYRSGIISITCILVYQYTLHYANDVAR